MSERKYPDVDDRRKALFKRLEDALLDGLEMFLAGVGFYVGEHLTEEEEDSEGAR